MARPVAVAGAAVALLLGGCDLGTQRETLQDPAHRVASGDLNGDGLTDLITIGTSHETPTNEGRVSVLMARPGGGFDVTEQVRNDVYDDRDTDVALVDADSDGDEDVILVDDHRDVQNNVYLLENEAGVLGPRQVVVGRLSLVSRVAVGDVDGDGHDDLVLYGADLLVAFGDGAGGFTLNFDTPRPYASAVEIADVDGDGLNDLIVGTVSAANTAVVEVYRRLPTGWAPSVPYVTDPAMRLPVALAVADLTGDGVLDLVAANQPSGVAFWDPGSVSVLAGIGDGTFAPPAILAGISRIGGLSDLDTGDLDGDGHTDVVMAHAGGARVFFGDGAGGLVDPHALNPSGFVAADVEVLDVDGDGDDDVVTAGTKLDLFPNDLGGARTHP